MGQPWRTADRMARTAPPGWPTCWACPVLGYEQLPHGQEHRPGPMVKALVGPGGQPAGRRRRPQRLGAGATPRPCRRRGSVSPVRFPTRGAATSACRACVAARIACGGRPRWPERKNGSERAARSCSRSESRSMGAARRAPRRSCSTRCSDPTLRDRGRLLRSSSTRNASRAGWRPPPVGRRPGSGRALRSAPGKGRRSVD